MTSTDYGDLSTTELAKQITDDYAVIVEADRSGLQRYLSLGAKLIALRPRIAPKHGDWQAKLKLHCPQVSYETANLCIRFVENFDKLEAYAAAENVTVTEMGIREARKALTKSKSTDKPNDTTKGKPANVVKGGVEEPGNKPTPRTVAPDIALEGLETDEVFHTLQNVYENRRDELLDLTQRLAKHFGMVLVLENTRDAFEKPTPTPSSATTGFERRI
jgi:hypothetical protein